MKLRRNRLKTTTLAESGHRFWIRPLDFAKRRLRSL
jgi:hypothetical protein